MRMNFCRCTRDAHSSVLNTKVLFYQVRGTKSCQKLLLSENDMVAGAKASFEEPPGG